MRDDEEVDAAITKGGWLPNTISLITGQQTAVTIGDVIMFPDDMEIESVLAHERGHVVESDWLGPLYMPATVAGYVIAGLEWIACNMCPFTWDSVPPVHDLSPMEAYAERHKTDYARGTQ